ncbi:MAG: ribonuclease J [Candidatus Zambryskibacteria bacterium CG10_big_fil_rev_8_21_14_0_10_34_34]|uniref:Ribonuclease J n=1 Tax=Candidatus Zambryskibacteria bacterium CG10_big_fil_rev_8_21_14_0_10_34_34 TaxID=1975114 RepID=A0A2H0R2H0_9BACT|nr:MAG: ribonuclease J [Candidatus Zambryskibacteria bacterium CG10_big_fil_rev_8_21_14_0_10_34_34]
MNEKRRNRIRSFHAPERQKSETSSEKHTKTRPYSDTRPNKNNESVRPRKSGGSFSRKRFSNSNSRFGSAENQKKETDQKPETLSLPQLTQGNIRIIPLGGVEEIGKNMTVIEIGDDIIVIDSGFQFKDADTPGVDYILPNTKYLEERKDKIRGVLITHGHLDHIGGIPYIMYRIGNPPIYSRALTTIMIKKRQEEFPQLPPLDIKLVEKEDTIFLGKLKVKFFAVTHTIPDSMGIIIETPYGAIVTPGDIKLEHEDGVPTEREQIEYARFEKEKVLLLLMDSTNVDNPGFSTPEKLVCKNLEEIIRNTKRRLIIGTFASQLERVVSIIQAAEKNGKKIVIEGRSMKQNIEIMMSLGRLKVKKETIISVEDIENYPPDRVVVLATGAQGDEFAALMRMSTKSHKYLKIGKRDTILLSSSIIPGNEKSVQKLKDNLSRLGAKIIHYRTSDVFIHSTGHGNRGELEWIHKKIKPKFFIPIHGNHYMLRIHEELAQNLGMPEKNIIVPDNGMIIEIQDKGEKIVQLKQTAPSSPVMVDGFAVSDVQEVVIRDRKMLSDDGMFVIVAIIDLKTGKLRKSPDLISRGFVYLRESQELLGLTRLVIKKSIEDSTRGMNPINFDFIKNNVTDDVARFLLQKTAKHPIVIPVVLGV